MIDQLAPERLLANVVVLPAGAERLGPLQQLVDERHQTGILGVARRIETQDVRDLMGQRLPFRIELARARVEQDAARHVALAGWPARDHRVERRTGRVPGEDVAAAAEDDRRRRGEGVEDPQQAGALHTLDGQLRPAPARPAGEQLEVGASGRAETEDVGERIEHRAGRQDPALLEPAQVVGAHAREPRDLFAPEPRHTPVAVRGELDVSGPCVVAPGAQEGTQLGLRLHAASLFPEGARSYLVQSRPCRQPRTGVALVVMTTNEINSERSGW